MNLVQYDQHKALKHLLLILVHRTRLQHPHDYVATLYTYIFLLQLTHASMRNKLLYSFRPLVHDSVRSCLCTTTSTLTVILLQ